jgi:hypothetical protein
MTGQEMKRDKIDVTVGCVFHSNENVRTLNWGDWWTSWCRVPGLSTQSLGQAVTIPTSDYFSTALYANDTTTPLMINLLNGFFKENLTEPKSWNGSIGCTNTDDLSHGVWLQEHLGWATLEQTMTYENNGTE